MRKGKRTYTLRARGERQAETRTRIVEAIMHLHEEVGPRNTTVSAIADRAGVERLTVYRHFPDEAAMFAACSKHHLELNPPPTSRTWAVETDAWSRVRRGLGEIYAYFSRTGAMFSNVYRDAGEYRSLTEIISGFDAHLRDLADNLAGALPQDSDNDTRTLTLRHAVRFSTWQALNADGVEDTQKVALIMDWLKAPEPRRKAAAAK